MRTIASALALAFMTNTHSKRAVVNIMICFFMVAGPVLASEETPFGNSFEKAAEIGQWQCDNSVTTEITSSWSSAGTKALQINIGAKVPWFGIRRNISIAEFRQHEYLEFDVHAVTAVDAVNLMLRSSEFQAFQITYDRLSPGETIHVRLRLPEIETIKFGEEGEISIWMINATSHVQTVLIDNIQLVGFGGDAGRLEKLIDSIRAQAAEDADARDLLRSASQALTAKVTGEQVEDFRRRWTDLMVKKARTNTSYHLVLSSPLLKVKRSASLADLEGFLPSAELYLEMAKNEYESKQLVFVPKADAKPEKIKVSVSDLVGPGGAIIPTKNTELRLVDEVDISGTTQFPGEKLVGLWPDPLLPNAEFLITPGQTQSVWLTTHTDTTTPPGEYKGEVAVTSGKRIVQTLPVRLTVWNFALPEKATLKTSFNAWSHNLATFYNYGRYPKGGWFYRASFEDIPADRQIAAIEFFGRYRASLTGFNTYGLIAGKAVPPVLQNDGGMSLDKATRPGLPTWNDLASTVLKTGDFIVAGEIGGQTKLHLGEEGKNEKVVENLREYVKLLQSDITSNGWRGKIYMYMLDEPHRQADHGGWSAVLKEAKVIKAAAPEVKTFVATGVLLPTPKELYLYKDIDAFCMLWDRTPLRDAQTLRSKGKEVWWYGCNVVYAPYPNWAVHFDNVAPRIMPVMSYKYNMDGILQWAVNLFNDENSYPLNGPRWPDRPWTMKGWFAQPGEAHLYYPGRNGDFWPSIRLSNWRDGMEDYEYLTLLKAKLPQLTPEKQERAKNILALNTLVSAPHDFSRNPKDFELMRTQIATLLSP